MGVCVEAEATDLASGFSGFSQPGLFCVPRGVSPLLVHGQTQWYVHAVACLSFGHVRKTMTEEKGRPRGQGRRPPRLAATSWGRTCENDEAKGATQRPAPRAKKGRHGEKGKRKQGRSVRRRVVVAVCLFPSSFVVKSLGGLGGWPIGPSDSPPPSSPFPLFFLFAPPLSPKPPLARRFYPSSSFIVGLVAAVCLLALLFAHFCCC